MILFVLVCFVSATAVAKVDLNKNVDDYLANWYSEKMLTDIKLNDIKYTWTEGSLWWKKQTTIRCSKGVLNLQQAALRRVTNATIQDWISATKPRIFAILELSGKKPFLFQDCVLEDGSSEQKRGDLTGFLNTTKNAVDFLYTYGPNWKFLCKVCTLKLELEVGAISAEASSQLLNNFDNKVKNAVINEVTFSIANSARSTWGALFNDGPKISRDYC